MRFHLLRLLAYLVAVLAVYAWARSHDPRPWVALVLAACPAVVGSPALLLSAEGIGQLLGWLAPSTIGLDDVDDVEVLDEAAAA